MRGAQADVREEFRRELCQMGQGSSDDQPSHTVADEAYLADAGDRAEGQDVLLDFCGKPLAHLHDVALSLVLVALREENDSVGVL